jgi:hypothetical protein
VRPPPLTHTSQIIRFSIFEVNLQTGELQDQPFRVLAVLLERPGEVITREELRSELWPADTFVDLDHSLNAAIKRLRDALGESAERPFSLRQWLGVDTASLAILSYPLSLSPLVPHSGNGYLLGVTLACVRSVSSFALG